MLAGEGAIFLYTAVFLCKAPPNILSIYIVIQGGLCGIEHRLGRSSARAAL